MTVDSSGQVGIGVSDPDRLLELESTGDCWIKVGSTAGTDRAFLVGTDSNHKFQVYDDTSDAMRFTIDTDGEVGIGTTSPDGQLDVVKDGGVAQLRVKSIGSGDDGIIDIEAISNKDAQIIDSLISHNQSQKYRDGVNKFFEKFSLDKCIIDLVLSYREIFKYVR